MLIDLFDDAPLWAWLLTAFVLGLLSYWIYRVCARWENREAVAEAERARLAKLGEAEGAVASMRTALVSRDAALAETREELAALKSRGLDTSASADALRLLKYQNWVLDTRWRRAIDDGRREAEERAARTPALAAGVAVSDQAAMRAQSDAERAASELKYQNWLLTNRLKKQAHLSPSSAELSAAEETDGPGLRYRNWLLSKRLRATGDAARSGGPIDLAGIDSDLTEAQTPIPTDPAAYAHLPIAPTPPPAASDDGADAAEVDRLARENAGLRYRNWLFGRGVGAAIGASRFGAALPVDELSSTLSAAGVVETEPEDGAAAAAALGLTSLPIPRGPESETQTLALDAAAATLRRRVETLEGELANQRSALIVARTGQAQAREVRAQLWRSEWLRRRADARAERQPESPALDAAQLAAVDEADALRRRAAQAEGELRRLRAEQPAQAFAALAPRPEPSADQIRAVSDLKTARADAAKLRARLWTSEWRLRALRDASAATPIPAPEPRPQPAPTAVVAPAMALASLDPEAPQSGVEAAALELIESGTFQATDANRPRALQSPTDTGAADDLKLIRGVGPKLEGLLNDLGLRHFSQLAQFDPNDIAWLDTKLAFRGRVVRDRWVPQSAHWASEKSARALVIGPERTWTRSDDPATPAMRSDPVARGALEAGREETVDTLAPPPMVIEVATPLSGAESAALELIEAGAVAPTDALRPSVLLDAPASGAPDDLKLIKGVGPKLEGLLNDIGVYSFAQLADLSPQDMAWIDAKLAFRGRLIRDRWTPQAQQWRDRKAAGALEVGAEGSWTMPARVPMSTPAPTSADTPSAPVSDADAVGAARRALQPAIASAAPEGDVALATPTPTRSTVVDSAVSAPSVEPSDAVEAEALALLADPERVTRDLRRPDTLRTAPPPEGADDLKLIDGVGPKLEAKLNQIGVHAFQQLADLSAAELSWLDATLGLERRSVLERWRPQAEMLATRKARGEMIRGPEQLWTLAGPAATPALDSRPHAALLGAPMTDVEREALALISGGAVADPARRPASLLDSPLMGPADDLTQISGVGPKLEALLNELGLYYYRQIAQLTASELAWIDAKLRFEGRVVRDRWAIQAADLDRRRAAAG